MVEEKTSRDCNMQNSYQEHARQGRKKSLNLATPRHDDKKGGKEVAWKCSDLLAAPANGIRLWRLKARAVHLKSNSRKYNRCLRFRP